MTKMTGGDCWTPDQLPDLSGRRAVVTGAASGLGRATASALARRGAHVILADRNRAGGETAAAEIRQHCAATLEFQLLDLADLSSVKAFADRLLSARAALDILVNVAGIFPPTQRATTRDGFELKFGLNHLGHFALSGRLLPALLRSPAPRVVSVSSIVHARGRIDFEDLQSARSYRPLRVYSQAKLACLMFALELHRRAQAAGSRLHSLAAHPGIARTAIGQDRQQQEHLHVRDWLEDWAQSLAMRWFGQDAEHGAWPLLFAAADASAESGGFYGPAGFGQFAGPPVLVRPAKVALDAEVQERLWAESERLTGVSFDLR